MHQVESDDVPRSRKELADVTCPTCQQSFQAEVWLAIDRTERPDLVDLLMDGELNLSTCPHCGAEGGLNHPLLFHDGERREVLCAVPLTVKGQDAARELVGDLLQGLVAALPPEELQSYLAEVELVPELDGLRAALIERALGEDQTIEDRLLAVALEDLLNVGGQLDFQRVIAGHRQLLLTERAAEALDDILKQARRTDDRELQRRAREAKAILGRLRGIVASRRRALAQLLDDLAPLSPDEAQVVPQLKLMLDAIDPQEVYAARIVLTNAQQDTLDGLIDRLCERAEAERQTDAVSFVRTLQALPRQ